MSQQQQVINIPMVNVAGLIFNVQAIVAFDVSAYAPGDPAREVIITLVGPAEFEFLETRADEAYMWILQFTGNARVEPVFPSRVPNA